LIAASFKIDQLKGEKDGEGKKRREGRRNKASRAIADNRSKRFIRCFIATGSE